MPKTESNSQPKRTGSVFNRFVCLTLAGMILAYLAYALIIERQPLSVLFLGALALVTLLVVVPFVSRVKIPNLIELDARIDHLKDQTEQNAAEMRNVVKSISSVRVEPVLNQVTVLGGTAELRKIMDALSAERDDHKAGDPKDQDEDALDRFMRDTRHLLGDVLMTLKLARVISIASEQKRQFDSADLGPETFAERVPFLVSKMIEGDLRTFLPDGTDLQQKTIESLKVYEELCDIYVKVRAKQTHPPSAERTQHMLAEIYQMNEDIMAAVGAFSMRAAVAQRRVQDAIPYLMRGERPPDDALQSQ